MKILRCRDVVGLVASGDWRDASLGRRVALLVHLAICRHCRAYTLALRRLGAAARRFYATQTEDPQRVEQLLDAVRRAAEQPPTE